MKRRESREFALKVLFSLDFLYKSMEDCKKDLSSLAESEELEDSFSWELVELFLKEKTQIDTLLSSKLKNWTINRLSHIDRNIIRLGIIELLLLKTEKAIVINEYIEIAKKYGNLESSSFINGILDSIPHHNENP